MTMLSVKLDRMIELLEANPETGATYAELWSVVYPNKVIPGRGCVEELDRYLAKIEKRLEKQGLSLGRGSTKHSVRISHFKTPR